MIYNMVNDAAQYAFVRNLQGDVIAIIDQDGKTVMEYSYDPWGNIEYHLNDTFENEQDAMLFTALCPLTYRGYNYDFTTGLYYLQSRYYNPEWGRFINCDDTNILLATQGETHNANLFAYCDNNPVNRVDNKGKHALNISNMNVSITIYDGYNVDKMDGTVKGYFGSILSGGKNAWIGHAEMNLGNLTCSYGAYRRYNKEKEPEDYGLKDKTKGCPASLIIAFDRTEWEAYNYTIKKRLTKKIPISVSYEEFIGLFIFYCSFIFFSDEDNIFVYDYKGAADKFDWLDNADNPAAYWMKIQLTEGEYAIYKYTGTNCCTVVLDALEFAMPERYKKALNKRGIVNDVLLKHPETLEYFLKAWE